MGKQWKEWQTLFWKAPKITANGDCSHEIKRHLLLGRKVMSNLDSILKSRDITLLTKVHLAKAMVFPVIIYGCESWTIKKAECRRTDAFELWCCRRLLRVSWTARQSNQSILRKLVLNIHWKDWCWSWSSNTFGYLMRRADSLEKTLILGKTEGGEEGDDRGWDGWMASTDMSLSKLWKMVKDRDVCHAAGHGVAKSQTWLSDWTTTMLFLTKG